MSVSVLCKVHPSISVLTGQIRFEWFHREESDSLEKKKSILLIVFIFVFCVQDSLPFAREAYDLQMPKMLHGC
jgi:hypothetical protein